MIQAVTSELSPGFTIVLDKECKIVEYGSDYSTVTDAFVYNSGLDMQTSPTRWDNVDLDPLFVDLKMTTLTNGWYGQRFQVPTSIDLLVVLLGHLTRNIARTCSRLVLD